LNGFSLLLSWLCVCPPALKQNLGGRRQPALSGHPLLVKTHFLSPPTSAPEAVLGKQEASCEQEAPRTAVDPENGFNLSLSH
jgi:hypothetical protein